ncbi:hypothetical protein PCANC_02201 [Puccinia coronata f. sp. avenae]|uniref:Extracellular mutant protein 11 C-terminal domain-containing protein n=2 Tax=Puccinia coronata f. sp. avenae TaxID=200324 RepID=A0A2N5W0S5_9BASI|nr:hypothetical protein PCANC_02201 [Puccinia coronata f. sp. avenae]
MPRPVLLRGFLMFVMTCHGLALIHDDESLLAARINPDAPSFPHVLQPIATSEVIPHVLQPFPTFKVNTAHSIPPLEEITTPAASSSFKQLGRLPASNKLNPPNNSGGLTSHFIPHSVSSNYWSDFELMVHDMTHVEHPSKIDQIMEEYQRLLESPPEEPLDVRKKNRNPRTTFQSADHEKQTTQNLGDIHDSSGASDLYTQFQIMKVPSIVDSPSSSPQDLQISSFSPGINLSQKRKPESAANLNKTPADFVAQKAFADNQSGPTARTKRLKREVRRTPRGALLREGGFAAAHAETRPAESSGLGLWDLSRGPQKPTGPAEPGAKLSPATAERTTDPEGRLLAANTSHHLWRLPPIGAPPILHYEKEFCAPDPHPATQKSQRRPTGTAPRERVRVPIPGQLGPTFHRRKPGRPIDVNEGRTLCADHGCISAFDSTQNTSGVQASEHTMKQNLAESPVLYSLEEAPTQAASTSFQWLGRLPSSNKFNPPNNSGGLTTHFIPHAVSPNYRSDFGLAGHVEDPDFGSMGYVEDPSRMDQLMEELQGLLETEEPLDVHENNPNPTTMLPSAHQERQTAQNLGDIHDSSGSFQVPSIFDNPSNSPRDLQISSFSPGSGSNPRQKRKSESATNLNESRLKNKIETLPSLINVGKFTHDSQRLQEQMASLLSKHTPNGPLGKKKPLPKPDSIRLPKFSRENDFPPVGIHNHVQQSRLPCIDEEGSLLLHSGAFSIENPSSTDTRKMKIFNSMVDNSNTSGKLLWILEDRLAACIEQFHGKSSINKDKTEVNDECGNRMKMRDSKREDAVTIINSKLDDWLKFYEAKCGIEYKDLGLFRDPGLEEDVMKTYFVLFLLRVDIISTVLVKKEPQISNVKITLSNNLDVLKYAAENFHHIYQQSRDRINQLKRNQVIDKYIRERASKMERSDNSQAHCTEQTMLPPPGRQSLIPVSPKNSAPAMRKSSITRQPVSGESSSASPAIRNNLYKNSRAAALGSPLGRSAGRTPSLGSLPASRREPEERFMMDIFDDHNSFNDQESSKGLKKRTLFGHPDRKNKKRAVEETVGEKSKKESSHHPTEIQEDGPPSRRLSVRSPRLSSPAARSTKKRVGSSTYGSGWPIAERVYVEEPKHVQSKRDSPPSSDPEDHSLENWFEGHRVDGDLTSANRLEDYNSEGGRSSPYYEQIEDAERTILGPSSSTPDAEKKRENGPAGLAELDESLKLIPGPTEYQPGAYNSLTDEQWLCAGQKLIERFCENTQKIQKVIAMRAERMAGYTAMISEHHNLLRVRRAKLKEERESIQEGVRGSIASYRK